MKKITVENELLPGTWKYDAEKKILSVTTSSDNRMNIELKAE